MNLQPTLLSLALVLFNCSWVFAQNNFTATEQYDFSELETGSDEFGSYSIGHNLSTNGRTLKKGQTSIGTLYLAHGLTEEWSIGLSPFVLHSFEMFNLMTRIGLPISKTQRFSIDLAYFKTFGGRQVRNPSGYCYQNPQTLEVVCPETIGYTGFVMEAANAKLTFSQQVLSGYRLNSTLSYFYFWDDRSPFSFRMDPANPDPFTLNLTTLHEFRIMDSLFLNYEVGLWGMNYQYPYFHTGLSLGMQTFKWLISFGLSTTYSFSFPERRFKSFPAGYTSQASIHPEFEIQYFF